LQGWQKGVIALQVRSAVLQYWPAPHCTLPAPATVLQPATDETQRPVKALQNFPVAQAASLVQTQRRISWSQRKFAAHSASPEQVPGSAAGGCGVLFLQAASTTASTAHAHFLSMPHA
jgi:hypothetical protein